MARIRTIKPEFPQSESLGAVSRDARLLFVNLFTIADDAGRLRGQSRLLASLLYPFDDGEDDHTKTSYRDVGDWLEELDRMECIDRYSVDGVEYIQITNWLEHQKIDRPSPSRIPECPENHRETSRASDALPRTLDLGPSIASSKTDEADFGLIFDEQFWPAYPRRAGSNPKKPARQKFIAACKRGEDPQAIVAGVKAYATDPATKVGTEYVKTAEVWLNKECWKTDETPTTAATIDGFTGDDALWLAKLETGKWFEHLWGPKTDPSTDSQSRIPRKVWAHWQQKNGAPVIVAVVPPPPTISKPAAREFDPIADQPVWMRRVPA